MKLIRNYKRVRWKNIVMIGSILIMTTACLIAVLEYYGWKNCLMEKRMLEEQINSYGHMVYVAAEKLPKGTVLTEEKLNQEMKYFNLQHIELITEEEFGKTLAQDVAEGTCLTLEMLCTETKNVREIFLSDIECPDYVQTGDRIDVRIRYGNAEDYIVLSDKVLKKYDVDNGIILELEEEEILLISSAYADSKIYEGTKLYMAKYPEYNQVAISTVNYIANREILELLGKEKTERESRTALEERLVQKR